MKRSVLLTIDDPYVTNLLVDMVDEHDIVMDAASVPVPPGDQLTRDLRTVMARARIGLGRGEYGRGVFDAIDRIRAALGMQES